MSVVNRVCVKNPTFLQTEDILKKHLYDYNELFGFFNIICEWKFDFDIVFIYYIGKIREKVYNT